jgi:hypothetical protein
MLHLGSRSVHRRSGFAGHGDHRVERGLSRTVLCTRVRPLDFIHKDPFRHGREKSRRNIWTATRAARNIAHPRHQTGGNRPANLRHNRRPGRTPPRHPGGTFGPSMPAHPKKFSGPFDESLAASTAGPSWSRCHSSAWSPDCDRDGSAMNERRQPSCSAPLAACPCPDPPFDGDGCRREC